MDQGSTFSIHSQSHKGCLGKGVVKSSSTMDKESLLGRVCGRGVLAWGPKRPLHEVMDYIGDTKVLEVPELCAICQRELHIGHKNSPRDNYLIESKAGTVEPSKLLTPRMEIQYRRFHWWVSVFFGPLFLHYILILPLWNGNLYSVPFRVESI